ARLVPAGIFIAEKIACWAGRAVSVQLEMSTLCVPALYSSMKESVVFVEPELMRNSLILTGSTFRTFSEVVSNCFLPVIWFVHDALATRSPLSAAFPEVTLNVALTLAPGAMGSANVFDASVVPATTEVHCLPGIVMLNFKPAAGAAVVFVNVTVVCCEEPGENVCSPVGLATADDGAILNGNTLYPAETTLACTCWSVASLGNVPAAVIAPS